MVTKKVDRVIFTGKVKAEATKSKMLVIDFFGKKK